MNTIDELIKEELEAKIDQLLKGEINSYGAKYLYISQVKSELEKRGFKFNNDFDSNGFQYDFWFTMTHHTHGKMSIGGSGYYGGLTMALNE